MARIETDVVKAEKEGILKSILFFTLFHIMHSVYSTVYTLVKLGTLLLHNIFRKAEPTQIEQKYTKIGHELTSFKKTVDSLSKVPKHIAFAVMSEKLEAMKEKPTDIIKSLAKEISWAYAADINVVSLYDHRGILKKDHGTLKEQVKTFIQENINGYLKVATKEIKSTLELPTIKVMNAGELGSDVELASEQKLNTLYIFIFSHENGRNSAIDSLKESIKSKNFAFKPEEHENNNISKKEELPKFRPDLEQKLRKESKLLSFLAHENNVKRNIFTGSNTNINDATVVSKATEESMDTLLNNHLYKIWKSAQIKSEPEVLVVHADINSTIGFLPWQIRLTEFFWFPEIQDMELKDFKQILVKYGNCNQKLGK